MQHKIVNGVLGVAVHTDNQSILYSQNAILFHCTSFNVIELTPVTKARPSGTAIRIFTKLTNTQHNYAQIPYIDFHPNWKRKNTIITLSNMYLSLRQPTII